MKDLLLGLAIAGGVFLLIDVIILVACTIYCHRKREKKRLEASQSKDETEALIPFPPFTSTLKPVNSQTNIDFVLPPSLPKSTKKEGGIDVINYQTPKHHPSIKGIPQIGFEFFYDFRTTQLKITLKAIKYIPKYFNEQVIVSILMSNSQIVYHSSKMECPDAILNEEFPFPLDSMEISSDPPIKAKFNVWHIDRNSRKSPYGYVEVNIEDVLSKTGIPADGDTTGRTEWRNIIVSDNLIDEGMRGEILLTLSYLSAAQRIGVTICKAKNLILTVNDKDLHVKITLFVREEERNSVVTNYTTLTQNPEFNQEFIFRFADLRNVSIDGITIRIEMIARQSGILDRPRVIGQCFLGNSDKVSRHGREHWVTTLTTPKTVTNWHMLKDPNVD